MKRRDNMSKLAIDTARSIKTPLGWTERRIILEHVTGSNLPQLLMKKTTLTPEQNQLFKTLVKKCESRIPIALVLGTTPFLDFNLKVSPWVFLPRPETEQLVESIFEKTCESPKIIMELGTGTGAISIALARKFQLAKIFAIDLSPLALRLAKKNALSLGVANRIHFIKANLFSFPQATALNSKVDLLISNPPYIPTNRLAKLPPQVRLFDPPLALDGGHDGFRILEKILDSLPYFLSEKGIAAFEIDPVLEKPLTEYQKTSKMLFETKLDSYKNLRFLFVRMQT